MQWLAERSEDAEGTVAAYLDRHLTSAVNAALGFEEWGSRVEVRTYGKLAEGLKEAAAEGARKAIEEVMANPPKLSAEKLKALRAKYLSALFDEVTYRLREKAREDAKALLDDISKVVLE